MGKHSGGWRGTRWAGYAIIGLAGLGLASVWGDQGTGVGATYGSGPDAVTNRLWSTYGLLLLLGGGVLFAMVERPGGDRRLRMLMVLAVTVGGVLFLGLLCRGFATMDPL